MMIILYCCNTFAAGKKLMEALYYKLDNPAWHSLTEAQSHFALGNEALKCYRKDIVSFTACKQADTKTLCGLDEWTAIDESFFIIGDMESLPSNYITERIITCVQMVCDQPVPTIEGAVIEKLDDTDAEAMLHLINICLPGYYLLNTRLMGDYYGIKHNGQLVSMTGERMRMDGLTEISAVVTHPDFTGRKYAYQLVAHVANKNFAAGIIPFLHTGIKNERAIRLYEHMGFVHRRNINFTKIKRIN
jgi:GNAT superfamily N-acetyltransferase